MFDLNDKYIIDDIADYRALDIEPLYWAIEDSIDDGDINLARQIYKAFVYIAKYRKSLLTDNLRQSHIERLKQIAYEIFEENSYKKQQSITIKSSSCSRNIPFFKESELRDYIVSEIEILSEIYKDDIIFFDVEVKTDFDYRCDIVSYSKNKCYPTEIKIGRANHMVVSQIDKYCQYFYKRLRYAMYKDIQGVVIANGFDQYSINELRKNGIWCVDVVPYESKVVFKRI